MPEAGGRGCWPTAKWVLAFVVAIALPSPRGYWRPTSLILWALVGDPGSTTNALVSLFGGLMMLALYCLGAYVTLSMFEGVVRPPTPVRKGLWPIAGSLFLVLYIAAQVNIFTRPDPLGVGVYLREHSVYWAGMSATAFLTWALSKRWPEGQR